MIKNILQMRIYSDSGHKPTWGIRGVRRTTATRLVSPNNAGLKGGKFCVCSIKPAQTMDAKRRSLIIPLIFERFGAGRTHNFTRLVEQDR